MPITQDGEERKVVPRTRTAARRTAFLTKLRARAQLTGTQIALDTATTAGVNAALLILASRLLTEQQLGSLTMVQLFATSAVILQRALLLTPGLAARRTLGMPAAIPMRWASVSVTALALIAAAGSPFALTTGEPLWVRMTIALVFSGSLLMQDYVRYLLFSRDQARVAVRMDVVWLVVTAISALIAALVGGWIALLGAWASASAIATLTTIVLWGRHMRSELPHVRLRDTLRLGRWSGLDNAMSIFSNILPMIVTTLALATPLAASYRVLQTALGPLNIINTTLIAGFGLTSYRLTTIDEIRRLSARVRRSTLLLGAATLIYTLVAFSALSYIAQIESSTALRVGVILGISALLGAATTPAMAAASALGYQYIGVSVRVLVVALSSTVSWMAASGGPVPWQDPIGVVAVGAAALGLVGWSVGYAHAARREKENSL